MNFIVRKYALDILVPISFFGLLVFLITPFKVIGSLMLGVPILIIVIIITVMISNWFK